MKIEPYKRRGIRAGVLAYVYRNLMRRDGVWYSIMQRGVVVGHAREILLADVRFVVREGGRQRVLETGRKNVHAFAVGEIVDDDTADAGAWWRGWYHPRGGFRFGGYLDLEQTPGYPLARAVLARLDVSGLHVVGPQREPAAHPAHGVHAGGELAAPESAEITAARRVQ